MVGLITAIIIFNFIAFKVATKKLSTNRIVHIIAFTLVLQTSFDLYIEFKYHGYWYFTKGIEYSGLLAHLFVVPPVNVLFIKWYPHHAKWWKVFLYYLVWEIGTLGYEFLALLPEPWGYFHYGWWNIGYSIILNPILLILLYFYYKWIVKIEKSACKHYERGLL
ncbi:hypothetical protein M3589_22555 [Heyndrickxia oleronia]|uniref:Uncharacterized protein n=1 Tax=Heyndrickxia oleronia TaxID=38875 RepID=A0AAW6T1E3_9BACI|nr:hypothetical protein [Heyndrickxia oleronia]MCM3240456.1 hypothetical protein [Heyndrickxia oleronia]MDH5162066.1 hypothetical protein [Heyndrickxia oleronia]